MMRHYGDITKLRGSEVPAVDIITGGSPCQDLSVAGKRAGLDGARSGLFMEQIRIIKEMRDHDRRTTGRTDKYIRPRFMVWENVQGAFSSNGGEDFRIVLEETAKIAENDVRIPRLEEGQRWPHAGTVLGDGWSIAWRLHDAQYWGVPQRRKRIALVADFGGQAAPEILFEREGVSRNIEAGQKQRKTDTPFARGNTGTTEQNNIVVLKNHPQDSRIKIKPDGIFQTMGARQGAETDPHTLLILELQQNSLTGKKSYRKTSHAKSANDGQGWEETAVNDTLNAFDNGETRTPTLITQPLSFTQKVRRLTPLECERLQGFPDEWTNIGEWLDNNGKKRKQTDSSRYKALGNSIALPFWQWLADRMIIELKKGNNETPTMGSLFDGIGGFPLVYSRAGCEPLWASEIEEFPIAVTKFHFGDQ